MEGSWTGGGLRPLTVAVLAVAVCLPLFACGGTMRASSEAAGQSDNEAIARSRPSASLSRLQARLARLETELDPEFSDLFENDLVAHVLAEARSEWRGRQRECRDDDCRRAIIADRVARLEYALGRRTGPVAGLTFPMGSMGLRVIDPMVGEILGDLTIYPVIDDRLLIAISTVNTPPFMGICGMAGEGRVLPDGAIQVTAPGLDGSVLRWEMRPEPDNRLTITPVGIFHNPWCGATVGIEDTFEIIWSDVGEDD